MEFHVHDPKGWLYRSHTYVGGPSESQRDLRATGDREGYSFVAYTSGETQEEAGEICPVFE